VFDQPFPIDASDDSIELKCGAHFSSVRLQSGPGNRLPILEKGPFSDTVRMTQGHQEAKVPFRHGVIHSGFNAEGPLTNGGQ